jgi:hypothetical protein
MNTKKGIAIVIIVSAIIGFVYYRISYNPSESNINNTVGGLKETNVLIKEINAVVEYPVPKGKEKLRFTLYLDSNNNIIDVKITDLINTTEVNENLVKFNEGLAVVIKGKKLNELNNVDRVGTSSLTTNAFNSALAELKAQI